MGIGRPIMAISWVARSAMRTGAPMSRTSTSPPLRMAPAWMISWTASEMVMKYRVTSGCRHRSPPAASTVHPWRRESPALRQSPRWSVLRGMSEHGDGLGEVARLVGIPAQDHGDAAGQVLEGEHRLQRPPRGRLTGEDREGVLRPAADADDPRAAGGQLGRGTRETRGRTALQHEHRGALLDQRDRPVL